MSDVAQRFHENWLGLVQPIDGLVVSIPALVAAECMEHQPPAVQRRLIELCRNVDSAPCIVDLWAFLEDMLQLGRDAFDVSDALPEDLHLYVPEGGQTLRPTAGLRKLDDGGSSEPVTMDDSTPASRAGSKYEMLLWQLPDGLALDKPETQTGSWEYPPAAKFDRLLRECRVPIGVLTNGQHVRLVYAPHGESSGGITFRLEDMVQVGGRPILDALLMLLSDHRWFGAEPSRRLPAILKDSRARQADVTNTLADQMFEALTILLQGFEAAAERDGDTLLREALAQEGEHVYNGLLTLLLRLVFVAYAEDRGLMPVEDDVYGKHLSVLALFDALQADNGAFPDTMGRRFGAYPRLLALFRAVFYGVRGGRLTMPPRRGVLFDPGEYPFLEGAGSGAPAMHPAERAELRVPSVSDETVHRVLHKLLVLGGQRLSYRALEVEQIGSVYEALMGYGVHRCASASVCLRGAKVWVGAAEVRDVEPGRRARWFEDLGLAKAQAKKIADAIAGVKSEAEVLAVLEGFAAAKIPTARAGALVIQPGEERRRTSSHYTPRSLTEPIVRRTLEPLIVAMGGEPPSEKLLRLKICDPAMGSGAFLVAACRFLADQVVAAWTRELDEDGEPTLRKIVASHDDPVMHARRLVAQKCLYGVDRNPFAVNLAKLSMWLETLAKHEPFTFVDHALKCGDSLVGLSIAQIRRFDWAPDEGGDGKVAKKGKRGQGTQLGLFDSVIERALLQAHAARRRLLELAEVKGDHVAIGGEKRRLHEEAELALERARMIGDVLVGAFFARESEKARVKEAGERKTVVEGWLGRGDALPTIEIQNWVAEIRARHRPFHWGLEFPEVFWDDRQDPLESDAVNRAAWVDAFVGNPPFAGKNATVQSSGSRYIEWLMERHAELKGKPNTDLCAYFFRLAQRLLGAHGTLGFIATNTISQGDTREVGLQVLLASGGVVYDAWALVPWPGAAAVAISTVHCAFGRAAASTGQVRLDGRAVDHVDSRLRAAPNRPDPRPLPEMQGRAVLGGKLVGIGLALTPEERDHMLRRNPANAERLRPYLGGENVNDDPQQAPDRYMIDFSTDSLESAEKWPDLLERVRALVKPARDVDNRSTYRTYWWRPGESAGALYRALAGLSRCLVCATTTKHLSFSFQPTTYFFANTLCVFALDRDAHFALLQSRIHEVWARLLGSSMRSDLRYTASDCFDTFPFPRDIDPIDTVGSRLVSARADFMRAAGIGLTKTYNALKDPAIADDAVVALRDLHVELDRAVLSAYGWADISVPSFDLDAGHVARRRFDEEVLDRLLMLNAERTQGFGRRLSP